MEEWGLPGLQARYEFVSAKETVELKLALRFDAAKAVLTRAGRSVWLELRDRIAEGRGKESPPAPVKLVTSLASAPLTVTADGTALLDRFVDFVSRFTASQADPEAPVAAALAFSLPKAGAATLPSDIFELSVRLDIGPVPIAIASPRLGEDMDVVAFAVAFEEAWQGFDGSDGRIALAVEDRPEGAALWCVRTGAKSGIALAGPAQPEVAYHAVPPLSTTLLSGTIEGASGPDWYRAIDLDSWWDFFAAGFDRTESAAGSGEIAERFKRVRAALAAGLADRLIPLAGTELGDGFEEVRAVYEAAAEADLRSRPVAAAAAVEVSRGTSPSEEPVMVLHGRALTPIGTASAVADSPAAVRLTPGRQSLAHAIVSPREDESRRPSPVRFEADTIEMRDSPPLRMLLKARGPTGSLDLDFERPCPPAPRIAPPAPLNLSVRARTCGDCGSLREALAWSVEVEVPTALPRQDRLELTLGFDEEAESRRKDSPTFRGALFEALGRAVLAAGAMPDEPDPAMIERFAGLAESVAEALPAWLPPAADVRPIPGTWRYSIDFRDLPALIVRREALEPGQLPPWPTISGFVTPPSEEAEARFEPEPQAASEEGLRLSFTGLRLPADQAVQVHGRTSRNANIVDSVQPAFVYPGTIESSPSLPLWLEWRAPQPEAPAARLESALRDLLGAIDRDSGAAYGIGLEAALLRRLDGAGEPPLESRIPLCLLSRVEMGGAGGRLVADLARDVAAALSAARAGLDAHRGDEEIALAMTLSGPAPDCTALARLDFRIAVPDDEAWWRPSA